MKFSYRPYFVELVHGQPPTRIYRPVITVLLHGPNGTEAVRFSAQHFILLGHLGCLEYVVATFDGDSRTLELVPNDSFPGLT